MTHHAPLFAGVAALLFAGPALAPAAVGDPAAGLQAMRELNLIVLGDLAQKGQNVEGKTFVGGNLSGGGQYGVGNGKRQQTASDRVTLTVVGNVKGGSRLNLHNGTNGGAGSIGAPAAVVVGGDLHAGMNFNTANVQMQVGGDLRNTSASQGSVIEAGGSLGKPVYANGAKVAADLGDSFTRPLVAGLTAEQLKLDADLKAASKALTALATTAGNSTRSDWGKLTLTAQDDGSGFSIFNLTDAIFGAREFDLRLANPDDTVIINISGNGAYKWQSNALGGLNWTVADNIIWNFADATSLDIGREVFGSILAPWASVTNSAQLSGSIVAGTMKMGGQVQLGTFNGRTPFADTTAVPEPATWAMLIAGFGLVGLALRRRKPAALAVVTQ